MRGARDPRGARVKCGRGRFLVRLLGFMPWFMRPGIRATPPVCLLAVSAAIAPAARAAVFAPVGEGATSEEAEGEEAADEAWRQAVAPAAEPATALRYLVRRSRCAATTRPTRR